ncbi:MAG: hypothetical protein ACW97X_10600 [Candidatus Hodarchaeales archaeon]|jgi:hypothetical protein
MSDFLKKGSFGLLWPEDLVMVNREEVRQIIETLLMKIESKDQEKGWFLIHDDFEHYDSRITIWAIRQDVRDIKETAVTDLLDFPNIEVKITYAPPSFFLNVLSGDKDVPYWQVSTVFRLLHNSEIIFDPKGTLQAWVDNAENIEWQPEVIVLKQKTTEVLLSRMRGCLQEDMLADAYVWLLKAAEEAICVPLMKVNAFNVGTTTLMLDTLKSTDYEIYLFFSDLLRISTFTPNRLNDAREELERLADHLFSQNIKTNREMWILAAFVSINESERRLNQNKKAKQAKEKDEIVNRLFETAVGELWQAFFLVAQNPRLEIKLDPWVVGSFWKWFGSTEIDDKWLLDKEKRILEIIRI